MRPSTRVLLIIVAFALTALTCDIFASCSPGDVYREMDQYCKDWCHVWYTPDDIIRGEWHGNDEIMKKTRCACWITSVTEGEFQTVHLVPFKTFEMPK